MKRYHSVSPTFRGKLDNESVRPNRVEKKQTNDQTGKMGSVHTVTGHIVSN